MTLEGFAADRPVVTLTDSGGPLEFVVGRRDRPGRGAGAHGRSPRRSTGSTPTARLRARLGVAGNALVRAEVPRWPDVVARLLD